MNIDDLNQIENTRQEMIEAGLKYGLNHELTVTLSKQLDSMLNRYFEQHINFSEKNV